MKPYYEHNGISLLHGDCLAVMPTLEAGSIDAIIADVPYGTTNYAWDSVIDLPSMWEQYKRLIKPNGAIVLTASQPFTSVLVMSNIEWFRYCWVWNKRFAASFANCNRMPMKTHEDICVFSQVQALYNPQMTRRAAPIKLGGRRNDVTAGVKNMERPSSKTYYDKYPESILDFSVRDRARGLHPTQKPVALFEYLIATYTNPGDLVLDNAAGSGTTLRAAKNLNRRAIGIEKEERFCAITARRMEQEVFAFEEIGA